MSIEVPGSTDDKDLLLSTEQRRKVELLLVEPNEEEASMFKTQLQPLGFKSVSHTKDHASALKMLRERSFSHILFTAKSTSTTAPDAFVGQVLKNDPETILIPCSYEPNIDNVFGLLKLGCRGFIVLPSQQEDIDIALGIASNSEPFSKSILNAVDRNAAFSALLSQTLDKLASITKDAEQYDIAKKELPRIVANFRSCVNLSRAFAEGGEDQLREKMISYFEKLSHGPATRLGKARRRLQQQRGDVPKDK